MGATKVSIIKDELIRKLWYIYTMEYYSAIKMNASESVLMRWMNLEPIISSVQFSLFQSLSRVRLFVTPWIAARQASLFITKSRSSPRLMCIESVMPSSHLILSSPSPLTPNSSQHQSLFQWISSLHEVAKVLEFQFQHQSFPRNPRADLQRGLVGSPCSPRDSQESSPTPQFKSINSLTLSLLHSPTLTSIHDHRKNRSLD